MLTSEQPGDLRAQLDAVQRSAQRSHLVALAALALAIFALLSADHNALADSILSADPHVRLQELGIYQVPIPFACAWMASCSGIERTITPARVRSISGQHSGQCRGDTGAARLLSHISQARRRRRHP